MKEKDQNQGWKHFKGDTIGVVLSPENSKTTDRPENGKKQRKAPINGTKLPWYQRTARKIVILFGLFVAAIVITIVSIFYYSNSRDAPLLLYADQYALHKGSVYVRNKEDIIRAGDKKGLIESVSYLNTDNQMLVTVRALGTGRYFAFVWVPKLDSFEGAYGMIDYNCDGQYTPMIIDGDIIIPTCFKDIVIKKMGSIMPGTDGVSNRPDYTFSII